MSFPVASEINGVAQEHILAIAEVCREQNTFLFVRPSEKATVSLIKQGFATKSMDIHEKSSDWGLHAGLVPQDPALSKLPGTPNPNIQASAHGLADSVQLQFTQAQFAALERSGHFDGHTKEINVDCDCKKRWPGRRHFHSPRMPQICQLMDSAGMVSWAARNPAASSKQEPVPVYVKAYGKTPVTGDYDMWMVAPHVTSLEGPAARVESIQDDHGRSAALDFTAQLQKKLNDSCKRHISISKLVFNHGAEANNLSFTQEMEKKDLVVFCPGDHVPFLIHAVKEPEKLTKLFHDMLRHGYVVMLNPKWKHGFTLGSEDLAFADPSLKMDEKSAALVKSARESVQQLAAGAATVIKNNMKAHRATRLMAELLAKKRSEKAEQDRIAEGQTDVEAIQQAQQQGTPKKNGAAQRVAKALLAARERAQLAKMPDEDRKAALTALFRMKDRAAKLHQFRLITNIPEVGDNDLIADPRMFPAGDNASREAARLAQLMRDLQESQFQRTRFVMEGEDGHQHLTPIDEQQAERADDFPYYQALYGKMAHWMWLHDRRRANFVRRKNTGIWPPAQ
jgi:hypothetical protein